MRICLFTSGYVRTLFHGFHKNIELIQRKLPNSSVDICYSFWDKNEYSNTINDPWHYIVKNDKLDVIDKNKIDNYFYNIGFSKVSGEIEPFFISEIIMEKSSFPEHKKRLASQYYKVYKVASTFFSDDYDLYLTIRPDVILQEFLCEEMIDDLNSKKGIVVNENYWYNALYNGLDCNEYMWASVKDTFISSNNQFLYLNELINQVHDCYGEILSGRHFSNMLSSEKISKIETFNFDYRIAR
jgi:hypothetical protein